MKPLLQQRKLNYRHPQLPVRDLLSPSDNESVEVEYVIPQSLYQHVKGGMLDVIMGGRVDYRLGAM